MGIRSNSNNNNDASYAFQKHFIELVKPHSEGKKFFIGTFGCQMNVRDSETLRGILSDMGYIETDSESTADLVVYNTCCVRENAENKVYGNLGILKNLKKSKRDLKVIVCGCMMQQDSVIDNIKKKHRHVDVIFGTFNIQRLPELLYSNIQTNSMIIDVWKEEEVIQEDLPAIRESEFKASVNIMFGCDNFCTYCVVPYVRGRERSRKPDDILSEVAGLAKNGVKEITLLGQNVNSYGNTFKEKVSFAELLKRINDIDNIERIRFITSHPKDISDELIYAMRDLDKVCHQLHLPFQSGSTRILEKMKRKYTKEDYLNIIRKIKEAMPDISLSTDIIVGFPGETEEDFNDTLDIVKEVRFASCYTFMYSKRVGTLAYNMPDEVEESVAKRRFNTLVETINPILFENNKSYVGKTLKVLAEGVNTQNNELISGRTEYNTIVHFKASEGVIGSIVDVLITANKTFYLMGDAISNI